MPCILSRMIVSGPLTSDQSMFTVDAGGKGKPQGEQMSRFWRAWFMAWCISLGLFGLVLAGGAIEATSGPVRLILSMLHRDGAIAFDAPLRFSLAVLGAVSLGWAVTLSLIIDAAIDLGKAGRPLWKAITAGLISWFAIDSTLSMVTGFGLNVLPNVLLAGMYVIGLNGSGVSKKSP